MHDVESTKTVYVNFKFSLPKSEGLSYGMISRLVTITKRFEVNTVISMEIKPNAGV
jgi:hypothetical protein